MLSHNNLYFIIVAYILIYFFKFSIIAGRFLHPYEQQRLKQVMTNSKRLEQLGISWIASQLNTAMAPEKNKRPHRNSEDSGSEYDPTLDDDTGGGDMMDVDSDKVASSIVSWLH